MDPFQLSFFIAIERKKKLDRLTISKKKVRKWRMSLLSIREKNNIILLQQTMISTFINLKSDFFE